MKTIVVGLGNPILGDDGVGWKVAEEVKKQLSSPLVRRRAPARVERNAAKPKCEKGVVDVKFLSLGGISLMEYLIGYQRAILVDAIKSDREIGSVIVAI